MKYLFRNTMIIYLFIGLSLTVWAQDNFDELSKKGNVQLVNSNYKKALDYFDAALKIGGVKESNMAWTASIAATCAQQLNDDVNALKYYKLAIENNTIDETVFDAALELAKKMKDDDSQENILLVGKERLESQYKRYTTKLLYFYFNSQMYTKVPAIADAVLQYKPDDLKTIYLKAVSFMNSDNEAEAISAFKYALQQDSLDDNTNRQLGFIYYNKGQIIYNNANDKYNAIVKPSRSDYSNYRKSITNSFDSFNSASQYLETAYRINPDEKIKKALFTLYTRLEQKDKASRFN